MPDVKAASPNSYDCVITMTKRMKITKENSKFK